MILFDLDGTLWDSSEQVAQSWNIIFRYFESGTFPEEKVTVPQLTEDYRFLSETAASGVHLPMLTADDIRNVMGKTMAEIARQTMPDIEPENRKHIFKICETYEVEYIRAHGGILFPGVHETLELLRARGHKMAIVSNCQEGYIEAFLDSMDMGQYFCDYEEWGRTGLSKGENIRLVMERNNCTEGIYVGDTQKDKDAAEKAGIPFVWASYGFGTADSCTASLEHFPDLLSVI